MSRPVTPRPTARASHLHWRARSQRRQQRKEEALTPTDDLTHVDSIAFLVTDDDAQTLPDQHAKPDQHLPPRRRLTQLDSARPPVQTSSVPLTATVTVLETRAASIEGDSD